MGKPSKSKRQACRRTFGKASGRHSHSYKKSSKKAIVKRLQSVKKYHQPGLKTNSFQVVRKIVTNKYASKLLLRRIKIHAHSKLISLSQDSLKYKAQAKKPTGNRIINLNCLQDNIITITSHTCLCEHARELAETGQAVICLKSEVKRCGLYSVIVASCKGCGKEFQINTSTKQANGLFDINVRAVWGTMASGGGCADLREQMSTMNVPPMSSNMFSSIERQIGDWWKEALGEEMLKAGAEERRKAIEKGLFHEDVPAITVICDGGWSKRSHKHTYNAMAGVAVIFGAETQKLLYIGIKNKYCTLCTRAENAKTKPKEHVCFKNWSESSQSMESELILEGFLQAEATHGIRYMNIIADGDSSVFAKLQENVPRWGRCIKKLECSNHTCKCLRSNLEKLVTEKPQYKGKGKLSKINRIRLATSVRCAIKMRSKDKDSKKLKHDIKNSIYHVLGFHDNCTEFCNKRKVNSGSQNSDDNIEENVEYDEIENILEQQSEFWKQPTSKDISQAKSATTNSHDLKALKILIQDVQIYLDRIANKCERLIGNFTTNLCESWMAIRAKFDGGKVINRCGSGSWEARCFGGALRKNIGPSWSPLTFNKVTNEQPGQHFCMGARRANQLAKSTQKYKSKENSKILRRKRKFEGLQQSTTKKAKLDYGNPLDDSPDVTKSELQKHCTIFMKNELTITENDITSIRNNTKQQHESQEWKVERRKRLTSSNFGKVMTRKTTNVSTAIVKNILYSTFKGNICTIRGLAQEENTIIEYMNISGNKVEKPGLQISNKWPFLAASTDGIVTAKLNKGLLEIKNLLQNNNYLIKEATKTVPNFCLENIKGKLKLKKNHHFFYQVQGQLNIFEMDWCDFVVRRTNPYDIHIERIYKDENLWINEMVPKLETFFRKFLLPELALPRHGTCSGIRQPEKPWFNLQAKSKIARKKTAVNVQKDHCGTAEKKKDQNNNSPKPSTSASEPLASTTRTRRSRTLKLLGRQILHKWIVDEKNKKSKWYTGTVIDIISGRDGDPKAVYEVLYEGEDSPNEVDGLVNDFSDGSCKFLDI